MHSTQVSRRVEAPRSLVYRALLDADVVGKWRVPDDMSSEVHEFDAREGGVYRISLSYADPAGAGKSSGNTDTFQGRFVKLVPDEQVVEVIEFETDDPGFGGEMTMTTTLTDADGGTEITILHEGLPDSVPAADNELGTRMSLDNLARIVEAAPPG